MDTAVMDDTMTQLTEPQRAAATHLDGPLLVLAGPGSGKTRVITHRIAYLLSQGIPAWSILALTFTNKAAGEMRQRIETMLADSTHDAGRLTITTFHSFCARMLRRFAREANISERFTIYDSADQREAIKQATAEADLSPKNWPPAMVGSHISAAKNQLIDAAEYAAQANDFTQRTIATIYRGYERILNAAQAVDFDDLLLKMARLLRSSEPVRTQLQRRFQYLLIDEYQDTNHAQFVIANTLASSHSNICVVGDPDQSIYGWRGADIRNILEFQEHYPAARVIPLGQNFRSTGHIVAASAGLIRHNRRRKHKDLHTELGDGEKPIVARCSNEHHEAQHVLEFFGQRNAGGLVWKDMAVLYRINALSRVMEEALRDAQIPYVIARGTAFYERKEIRDALSYLRLIVNPADDISLRRIVNVPSRGIGKTSLERFGAYAMQHQTTLFEALRNASRMGEIGAKATAGATKFVALIDRCRAEAAGDSGADALLNEEPDLAGLVERVIRESGMEAMYAKSKSDEDADRLENLEELISAASQFSPTPVDDDGDEHGGPTTLDVLAAYLESVALVSDADAIDPESGAVTLMTLHAAKGLEFDTVAMIGLEEGLLPHSRAQLKESELEEERRLCFVGMTRARRHLLMTNAAVRTHRGLRESTIVSQFIAELPGETIEAIDVSHQDEGFDDEGFDEWSDDSEDESSSRGRSKSKVATGASLGASTEFPVGCMVRHPRFGLGRVEAIGREGKATRARINFTTGGTKTLIVEYANLKRVK